MSCTGREKKDEVGCKRGYFMPATVTLPNKMSSFSDPEVVGTAPCTAQSYCFYYYFCCSAVKAMLISNSLTFQPLLTLLLNFKKVLSLAAVVYRSLLRSKS